MENLVNLHIVTQRGRSHGYLLWEILTFLELFQKVENIKEEIILKEDEIEKIKQNMG